MAMVCPQCRSEYDQRLECPRCDVRLIYQGGRAAAGKSGSRPNWQHTVWGRVLIGLILAQGIYHGVRHLIVAGLLAAHGTDPQELWSSLNGFLLLQSMQLIGLFCGGLLAGAGQRQGAAYGMLLGIWNGVLVVLIQPSMTEQFNTVTLYGLPLLQAAVGALAGFLGGWIWQPLTPILPAATRAKAKLAHRDWPKLFVGPVYWVRVVMGTAVAVGGALWAGVILDRVVKFSEYALSPASASQAEVVTWEIVSLAILTGGVLAGATTRNGMTQGLAVGVITAVILCGIRVASPNPPTFFVLAFSMLGPVILGIMGGGFGSHLLPPVVQRTRSFDTP